MTLFILHAGTVATLASDDPVIAAADLPVIRDATDALVEAARLREAEAAARSAAQAEARAAGHEAGYAEGAASAAEEARSHLLALTTQAAAERQRLRDEVSRLAIEVVRRIAGEVGAPDVVAGIAERAAADLLPEATAIVRVKPEAVASTEARLAGYAGLTVIGDATLATTDCLFETPLGISHAGLDIQLAAVERAWDAAKLEAADAH